MKIEIMKDRLIRFLQVIGYGLLIFGYINFCGSIVIAYEVLAHNRDSLFISGLIAVIPMTIMGIAFTGCFCFLFSWLIIAPINYIITGNFEGL